MCRDTLCVLSVATHKKHVARVRCSPNATQTYFWRDISRYGAIFDSIYVRWVAHLLRKHSFTLIERVVQNDSESNEMLNVTGIFTLIECLSLQKIIRLFYLDRICGQIQLMLNFVRNAEDIFLFVYQKPKALIWIASTFNYRCYSTSVNWEIIDMWCITDKPHLSSIQIVFLDWYYS